MANYGNNQFFIEEKEIVTFVSDFFCTFTQYDRLDLIGITTERLFHELLRMKINTEDINPAAEAYLFTRSFEARHVSVFMTGVKNGRKKYRIKEIPNSRFEEKNQAVEKLLSDNRTGVGIYTAPDYMLIKANDTYMNYLPHPFNSKEQVYGKYLGEFIKDFEGSSGKEKWDEIAAKNQSLVIIERQGLMLSGDGQYWDNTLIPVTENGQVQYIVSILDDVTERVLSREHISKQAKKIKDQNKELEAIIQNISEGLSVIDHNGRFILINDFLREKMKDSSDIGFMAEKAGGTVEGGQKYYSEDGKELSRSDLPTLRVLKGERIINERILVKHGLDFSYVDFSAVPVFDDNGEFMFGVITSHDITALVQSQKQLKDAQEKLLIKEREKTEALQAAIVQKDEFLSLISHEFKTPLTVINSAIQTMEILCRNELSSKAFRYLGKIRQNTYRQLRLVNNLLDITKINSGRIKLSKRNIDIVFLTKAITDSVQLFAIQRGIELSFTTAFRKKIIGIDDEKYERILLNLLSNAVKFTPPGKSVKVHLHMKKGSIHLVVKDEGVGIPQDKQKLIFDRFGQVDNSLTRHAEGTGIGLTLVKDMVNAFGGSISVESNLGAGSTFTVTLPCETVAEDCVFETADEADNNRLIHEIAVQFSDIYIDSSPNSEDESANLHNRIQSLLVREEILKTISYELSMVYDLKATLNSILYHIKQLISCEALGIRLYHKGDYPYFVYQGFPESFIELESRICRNNKRQESSGCGKHSIECICGRVINGEINAQLSFYTNKGSYWTNHASSLSSLKNEVSKFSRFRGACINQGYESSALIPIKSGGKTIGLIQLNDTRKNIFTNDLVEFLEMLGEQIGPAVEISLMHETERDQISSIR